MALSITTAITAAAQDFEIGALSFSINPDQTVSVKGYNPTEPGECTIPDKVLYQSKTYTVTAIGDFAFGHCSNLLTGVSIPSTITTIGADAFHRCSALESVIIPSSVTLLGTGAFNGCSSLESVTLPSSLSFIGNYTFYECSALSDIRIPETVEQIGSYAFSMSGLTSVKIPASVSYMKNAFSQCPNLTVITVDEANQNFRSIDGVLYNKDASSLILCPAFHKEFDIPATVTTLEPASFYDCTLLSTITIPAGVTTISNPTFMGCVNLTEIIVDKDNQYYASEDGILYNKAKSELITCPEGKKGSVTLPETVSSIWDGAFMITSETPSIHSLYIKAINPPASEEYAFGFEYYPNVVVYVPRESLDLYKSAPVWKNFTTIEPYDFSSITKIDDESDSISVTGKDNSIIVSGKDDAQNVLVYDSNGKLIANTTTNIIPVGENGVYLIVIGHRAVKVII